MKKLLIIALGCFYLVSLGCSTEDTPNTPNNTTQGNNNNNNQTPAFTAIPDPVFEQNLIDLGYDTELDGEVRTSLIENVTDLVLNEKGISDVTGLEDFSSLSNLWLNDNELTSIDVSNNGALQFLYVVGNDISELQVSNLANLEKLGADRNLLTSIDVSNNLVLEILEVSENDLEAVDVSANNVLNVFAVEGNPLDCITTNSTQLNDIPDQWTKDPEDVYSLNCN